MQVVSSLSPLQKNKIIIIKKMFGQQRFSFNFYECEKDVVVVFKNKKTKTKKLWIQYVLVFCFIL